MDRLEEAFPVTGTDWRDLDCGILPSTREVAFLLWLQREHVPWLDELRALVAALPSEGAGPSHRWPTDPNDLAYLACAQRYSDLFDLWDQAGQPDSAGSMDPKGRAMGIRTHEHNRRFDD
jgi:hypothetical protein